MLPLTKVTLRRPTELLPAASLQHVQGEFVADLATYGELEHNSSTQAANILGEASDELWTLRLASRTFATRKFKPTVGWQVTAEVDEHEQRFEVIMQPASGLVMELRLRRIE